MGRAPLIPISLSVLLLAPPQEAPDPRHYSLSSYSLKSQTHVHLSKGSRLSL